MAESTQRATRRRGSSLARGLLVAAFLGQACSTAPSVSPTATALPSASQAAGASPPTCPAEAAGEAPAWRDRVFYELFVRSFSDADGDGIGDLAGLTTNLDYLNDGDSSTTDDLGVTGVWLMPVAEAESYHGYDVIDYAAVEHDYGDMAAMRALVAAAHERGILVIVDFVINHTSSEHPWFRDALAGGPHRDWYVWSRTDPGWPAVAGPNPWHRTPEGDYYYGAFWEGMPDLNLRNPDVTAELKRIAKLWLDDVGIDGFRIDAAKHLVETGGDAQINTPETKAWLADFRDAVHAANPEALVLGEVFDARGISSDYTRDGALDMAFDFGIGPAIGNGVYGDAATIMASLEEVSTRYDPGVAGTFLTNHDEPRVATQLKGDVAAEKRAASVLLTGPGVPFVYYGEELGLTGAKPDERIRTPFPWTAQPPGHGFTTGTPWEPFEDGAATTNLATERTDPASVWSIYRDLIHLRDAHPALLEGSLTRVKASSPSVAAFVRAAPGERLLVVLNLGSEAAAGVSLDLASGPLCGTPRAKAVYASESSLPEPVTPQVSATGGFAGYMPFAELPAGSSVVLDLTDVSP